MPKTAVGLFENPALVDQVVREIEALGFPRQEVHIVAEAPSFEITGVMSFPRIDFEVELTRELHRIGASPSEAQAYVDGLRRGGALVLATGPDKQADAAADVMNCHGATGIEETTGPEPYLPQAVHGSASPLRDRPVLAGRLRQSGKGASLFVW